jgi:hypothetical protein
MESRASILFCLILCFSTSVFASNVRDTKVDYPGTQWEFIEDELLSVPWYTKLAFSPVPWLAGITVNGIIVGSVSEKTGFKKPEDLLSGEKWKESIENVGKMLKENWPLLAVGGLIKFITKYVIRWSLSSTVDAYILNRFFFNWRRSNKWKKGNMENTPEKLRPFLQMHYRCFKDPKSGGLEYLLWNAEEIRNIVSAAVELNKSGIEL